VYGDNSVYIYIYIYIYIPKIVIYILYFDINRLFYLRVLSARVWITRIYFGVLSGVWVFFGRKL